MTAGSVAVPTIIPLRAPIPGQHKTCIDSNTKIELRSETQGASIYFTTNGAKPAPFQTIGPDAKSTHRYREPFRLPPGKKSLKVLAVSECGMRESHVVTRTFDVEQAEGDPPDYGEDDLGFMGTIHPHVDTAKRDIRKFSNKMVTSKEAWREIQGMKANEDMMREMALHGSSNRHRVGTGTRHLNNRMGSEKVTVGSTVGGGVNGFNYANGYPDANPHRQSGSPKRLPPDSATQALRLQRETDFLKCVYCYADRPSDPYARFCNECGNPVPPLPQSRMPPPEEGQMGTCVSCKSLVPFNTGSCLVCEAPIGPQNVPQASIKLADKLMCMTCGTANPSNMLACVTCEARLTSAKPIHYGTSAPPMPKADGRLLTCTKCGRVNNPDARFCDWCGAKPAPPTSSLVCSKCTSSNHPYSKHCASCGSMLEPPVRADVRNSGVSVNQSGKGTQAQWMPVTMPTNPVAKCEMATQTVGLFYPSNKEIQKKNKDEEEKLEIEKQIRDRKPLMTAISPGRGYWRKQMEHVASNLKAYASNNTEFRALIGEPRMGKLISATVHEDGYELSLTTNFALRGNKDPFVGKEMGVSKEFLSSYTTGRKSSLSRYGSQDSLDRDPYLSHARASGQSTSRSRKKSARKSKKKKVVKEDKLSEDDKKLLKEVGKNGDGNATEVQQLIDEGADPSLVNKDDVPLLVVATKNKHVDAIPILVQEGADIDVKAPETGNTALHEAALLGYAGMETIDTLINCGAHTQKKNNKGETPYDLAVKAGHDSVANKLASSLGQTGLDKMLSKKTAKFSDAFDD